MDAFLSLSLQELSRYVRWMVNTNLSSRNRVDDRLVKRLDGTLSAASGVLNAAEGKQLTNENVRRWLFDLKDAICSAEDLVDEISFDAIRSDLDGQSGHVLILKVRKFSPFRYSFTKKIENGIQKILDMLDYIVEKRYLLGLTTDPITFKVSDEASFVAGYDIYGRDADKEAITNLLYGIGNDRVSVIPIVGMGGIGKTALAQLVFDDIQGESGQHFTITEWFSASYESNVSELIKMIYGRVIHSKNCGVQEKLLLQRQLKKFLEDKRFFIVLDNVWNLSYESWDDLMKSFDSAAYGSKILVTTRNENIAKTIGSVPNHYLQLLSEEDGWELFSKDAFNNGHPSEHPELEEIGKKIVQKCQGLPLAIKSLAGLLHKDPNPTKWNNVLKDEIWDLKCKILPALWLSYYYLPSYLKRCFAYCSIFPKGYEFEKKKKKLILLWMAEGLLLRKDNQMLEDIGEDYFGDLASRSLFHKDKICGFIMHDLMHDLAKYVAGESCFRLDANTNSLKVPLKTLRHLSWTTDETIDSNKLRDLSKDLSKTNILRTLLPLNRRDEMKKTFLVQPKKLKKLRYLRVLSLHRVDNVMKFLGSIGKLKLLRYLDLSFTEIQEVPARICCMHKLQTLLLHQCSNLKLLPNSIGNLKQLRYLDLSETKVNEIPETICNLYNLHTLLLGYCQQLKYLPTNMDRLTNLRHLDIRETSLSEMPPQISKLSHLETLSDFVVGTNSDSSIKGLGGLQSLARNLTIRNLERVENVDAVVEANLRHKEHITDLYLEWTNSDDSQKAEEVLCQLQPHTVLEVLSIINYGGKAFPCWIGDPSFSHMVKIWLSKCKRCDSLPPLGQLPLLKSLHIDGFDMMKTIGDEFYTSDLSAGTKPFLSLEKLVFKFMPKWEEWSSVEGEVFSQLKELHLIECPSLTINADCFPKNLPSLMRLWIENCQQHLVASLLSGEHQLLSYLCIRKYVRLTSFPDTSFPTTIHKVEIYECENLQGFSEEGLLSNLRSLSICRCEKLFMPPIRWSLKTLTSLTSLHFNNINKEVNSFPEDGQLPTSLTSLKLSNLHDLKSLNGKAFKLLTSLDELSIYDCKKLSCLPEERLPKSLTLLDIRSCELLNGRCQRDEGVDWYKIAHVPRICIDNQNI